MKSDYAATLRLWLIRTGFGSSNKSSRAILASLNRASGVPFHVASLKHKGATCEEVISAILVGLPVAGYVVTQALPAAIKAMANKAMKASLAIRVTIAEI